MKLVDRSTLITIFRRIREKLIGDGNFQRYLIYAIGEILLVVIGILIALQVNNWNEERVNERLEVNYLLQLKEELNTNIVFIKRFYLDRYETKVNALENTRQYYQGNLQIEDSTEFALQVGLGALFSTQVIGTESVVFEEMKNTGNLNVIDDEELRRNLMEYYGNMEAYRQNLSFYDSGYLFAINALRPFNGAEPNLIDSFDVSRSVRMAGTEKFYELTNAELTYAHIARYFMNLLVESAQSLIDQIDKNLDNR